jgi:hypothetical protein
MRGLVQLLEQYYHPSNGGQWGYDLSTLLHHVRGCWPPAAAACRAAYWGQLAAAVAPAARAQGSSGSGSSTLSPVSTQPLISPPPP